jgi:predicted SPOUT superfamily RNA methylase MTH1
MVLSTLFVPFQYTGGIQHTPVRGFYFLGHDVPEAKEDKDVINAPEVVEVRLVFVQPQESLPTLLRVVLLFQAESDGITTPVPTALVEPIKSNKAVMPTILFFM